MRALWIGLLGGVLLAPGALGATLRAFGTLHGPLVHIADIWDGTGASGARVLGPSPDPGATITVAAGQLAAIAQSYGVDWQPQSDGDSIALARPGTPLAREDVIAALRPALAAQGAGSDPATTDIDLPFYDPPMLDADVAPRLVVEETSLDLASGRFAATIRVDTGLEATPLRLHLAGTVTAAEMVPVPTHRLLPGAPILAGDLALRRVQASTLPLPVAQDVTQAIGMEPKHPIEAGLPLVLADLQRPQAVSPHERVMVSLALPGLDVGAVAEAMEAGAVGDEIRIRNPISGAILSGEITAPGQVRVDPDAPPAMPATTAAQFAAR